MVFEVTLEITVPSIIRISIPVQGWLSSAIGKWELSVVTVYALFQTA